MKATRMTSAVLGSLLMSLGLLATHASLANEKDITERFSVNSGGTLTLESDSGSIKIRSHNEQVVEVNVENPSESRGFVVNFKQSGDDVSVIGESEQRNWWGWWGSSNRIKYVVYVPQNYNLKLKTGGGSIDISDLEGDIVARTSGGSIKLGKITGDVKVRTSGGSIKVDEVAGLIDASTSGGSVRATLTQQPTQDSRLTTSGGSVTAYLAKGIAVDVVAKTSGGSVSSEFKVNGYLSKRKIEGEINGGGPELYLRTSGGSVRIKEL